MVATTGRSLLEPRFHGFSVLTPGEKLGSLVFSCLNRNRVLKVFHGTVGVMRGTSSARATSATSTMLRYGELGSGEQQKCRSQGCKFAHTQTSFETSVVRRAQEMERQPQPKLSRSADSQPPIS